MFLPISLRPPRGMIRRTGFLPLLRPFPEGVRRFCRAGAFSAGFSAGAFSALAGFSALTGFSAAGFGALAGFSAGAFWAAGFWEPPRRCPRLFREREAGFSSLGASAGFSGAGSAWFSAAVRTKPRCSAEAFSAAGAAGFRERPERLYRRPPEERGFFSDDGVSENRASMILVWLLF